MTSAITVIAVYMAARLAVFCNFSSIHEKIREVL
jgi:hypothetical protein